MQKTTRQTLRRLQFTPFLLFTPICAQGGPLRPNHFKYFPVGILVRNLHNTYIHVRQPYISKKKKTNKQTKIQNKKQTNKKPFKMAAKKRIIFFRENSHMTKIRKRKKTLSRRNLSIKFGAK